MKPVVVLGTVSLVGCVALGQRDPARDGEYIQALKEAKEKEVEFKRALDAEQARRDEFAQVAREAGAKVRAEDRTALADAVGQKAIALDIAETDRKQKELALGQARETLEAKGRNLVKTYCDKDIRDQIRQRVINERRLDALALGKADAGTEPDAGAEDAADEAEQQYKNFKGINLGIGPSVFFDVGGKPRIKDAEVVNGRVVVEEEEPYSPGIMFETHYFFTPCYEFLYVPAGRWGFGPFVGLQTSTEDVIDALAFGMMYGARHADDAKGSFNLGVGIIIDPNKQILGKHIVEGGPVPAGQTDVPTKEVSAVGLVLTVSFSF